MLLFSPYILMAFVPDGRVLLFFHTSTHKNQLCHTKQTIRAKSEDEDASRRSAALAADHHAQHRMHRSGIQSFGKR
jgi:hypothetical protein